MIVDIYGVFLLKWMFRGAREMRVTESGNISVAYVDGWECGMYYIGAIVLAR